MSVLLSFCKEDLSLIAKLHPTWKVERWVKYEP